MAQRITRQHHAAHWTALLRALARVHAGAWNSRAMHTTQIQLLSRAPPTLAARPDQPLTSPLQQAPGGVSLTSTSTFPNASPTTSPAGSISTCTPSLHLRIHPSGYGRNNSAWTADHDLKLLSLRAQGKTWNQVGEALGRSRQACSRRFDSVLDPEGGTSWWALHPDRNRILKELVRDGLSWKDIALQLKTKASACERQWRTLERQEERKGEARKGTNSEMSREVKEKWRHSVEMIPPSEGRFRMMDADLKLLKSAVEARGKEQWAAISENVFGSRFTAAHLRHQYMKLEHRRKVWTEQQDQNLLLSVANWFKDNHRPVPSVYRISDLDSLPASYWESAVGSVPGEHTASECKERWFRLQLSISGRRMSTLKDVVVEDGRTVRIKGIGNPRRFLSPDTAQEERKASWTPEQSRRLESIIHGMKRASTQAPVEWDEVSAQMDFQFTKLQCKSRWNRMLRQATCDKCGPWSKSEVENLIHGVYDLGCQWTQICRKWVPSRNPTFIQGKWKGIASRVNKEVVIRQWTWPQACVEIFGEALGEKLGKASDRWPSLGERPSKRNK